MITLYDTKLKICFLFWLHLYLSMLMKGNVYVCVSHPQLSSLLLYYTPHLKFVTYYNTISEEVYIFKILKVK